MSPHHPNLPPFDIRGDEDLKALKFLNFGLVVSDTLIHCVFESTYEAKPFGNLKPKVEFIDLQCSAPQSSPDKRERFIMYDRKRKSSFVYGKNNKASSSKASKPSLENVISPSNDEEEEKEKVVDEDEEEEDIISTVKHKSVDFVNLSDDDDEFENLSDDGHFNNFSDDHKECEDIDYESTEFLQDVDSVECEYLRKHRAPCEENFVDLGRDNGVDFVHKEIVFGVVYGSNTELHMAIRDFALKNCFEVKVKRSKLDRLSIVSKEKTCSFSLFASSTKGVFFVIKFNIVHICGFLYHHDPRKQVTASYILPKLFQGMIYLYLYLCILFHSNFMTFHERLCI